MKTLGKYQILEEIGKGDFATVYRAKDIDLEREVALKVMYPMFMRDPLWVKRFRQEARAIARLEHPHIIAIYEVGQSEGVLFIATRLVEDGSLADRLAREGPLPWDEVVRLVSEIASALDYAHEQGVLHRDLKPANILLDRRADAVLTDFGFARIVSDHTLSVSMSGGLPGTPAYIPPEIWDDKKATPQTDIYALGCILYELVSGEALFSGKSVPAVMRAHFKPRSFPESWPEGVPPGMTEVLETALAIDPGQRYATAGELAQAVRSLSVDAKEVFSDQYSVSSSESGMAGGEEDPGASPPDSQSGDTPPSPVTSGSGGGGSSGPQPRASSFWFSSSPSGAAAHNLHPQSSSSSPPRPRQHLSPPIPQPFHRPIRPLTHRPQPPPSASAPP